MSAMLAFSGEEIQHLLPHRCPFLFLDRAYDVLPGDSGKGTKLYSSDEWYFAGHFPREPIVPGVLEIEALAQLTAVVYVSRALIDEYGEVKFDLAAAGETAPDLSGRVGYLAKANVKFVSIVRPGMQLDLDVRVKRSMGLLSIVAVSGRVGSRVAVEGELTVSERKSKE